VWFDQATKQRRRIVEVEDFWDDRDDNDDSDSVPKPSSTSDDTSRKEMPDASNEGTDGLRNVRWSVEQTEPEPDWSAGLTTPRYTYIIRSAKRPDQCYQMALRGDNIFPQPSNTDPDFPAASSMSRLDDDNNSHQSVSKRPRLRKPAINMDRTPACNHALEDLHMQLILLEQENRKRLLMGQGLAQKAGEAGWPQGRLVKPNKRDMVFTNFVRADQDAEPNSIEGRAKQRSPGRLGRQPRKAAELIHVRFTTNGSKIHSDSEWAHCLC
jgi:hypothetical protein